VISDGVLIAGSRGMATELGHVVLEPNGPACGCGNWGCLEIFASANAFRRLALEGRRKWPTSKIFELVQQVPEAERDDCITSIEVFAAAREGDVLASLILDRVITVLARAIANLVHTFDPEVVVLGGGIAEAGDAFLEPLQKKVDEFVLPPYRGNFTIEASKLGYIAGILGAASIPLHRGVVPSTRAEN